MILPDDKMPVMVDKNGKKVTVDVVMNPYSTINRKISSVNMESLLGSCIHRIYDLVEEYKTTREGREKIMPLIEKYYPGRYTNMTVDEFIDLHNKSKIEDLYYINVGSYSRKYTPQLIDQMALELNVEPQNKILMPADMIADKEELKKELSEDEYNEIIKSMEGKYVPVDKPLNVGYITLLSLYHIPMYSNKVTSSLFGQDINEWKDSPIMGRGAYRKTGQKIGEMELTALLATGNKDFIHATRSDTEREDNQRFLNNLLGLGLTVTDKKGYKQGGSTLKDRLGDMKIKFRQKNQR